MVSDMMREAAGIRRRGSGGAARGAAVAAGAASIGALALHRAGRRAWARATDPCGPHGMALPPGEEDEVVTDDGAVLSATVAGPPGGRPVVLAHCFLCTRQVWGGVARRLVDDGHRVVLYDHRGHGTSTLGSEPLTIGRLGTDLRAVLEHFDLTGVVVAGHSIGGMAAQSMAVDHLGAAGARLRGLVLVGAACTPDSLDGFDRLLALPVLGEVLTVAGLLALGEVLPKVRRLGPRVPAAYRDQFLATLPDQGVLGGERGALGRHRRTFVSEQRALIDELPVVHAALPRITVPTAVVVGSWDVVVRPGAGRTLADAIGGAELVEIPRAGHFVARDTPVQLAGIVERYGLDGPVGV